MTTKLVHTAFRRGDKVVLTRGTYPGTQGVFLRFREDAHWADIRERDGRIRSHPVVWLAGVVAQVPESGSPSATFTAYAESHQIVPAKSSAIEAWESEGGAAANAASGRNPATLPYTKPPDHVRLERRSIHRNPAEATVARRVKSVASSLFVMLVVGTVIYVLTVR